MFKNAHRSSITPPILGLRPATGRHGRRQTGATPAASSATLGSVANQRPSRNRLDISFGRPTLAVQR